MRGSQIAGRRAGKPPTEPPLLGNPKLEGSLGGSLITAHVEAGDELLFVLAQAGQTECVWNVPCHRELPLRGRGR